MTCNPDLLEESPHPTLGVQHSFNWLPADADEKAESATPDGAVTLELRDLTGREICFVASEVSDVFSVHSKKSIILLLRFVSSVGVPRRGTVLRGYDNCPISASCCVETYAFSFRVDSDIFCKTLFTAVSRTLSTYRDALRSLKSAGNVIKG